MRLRVKEIERKERKYSQLILPDRGVPTSCRHWSPEFERVKQEIMRVDFPVKYENMRVDFPVNYST